MTMEAAGQASLGQRYEVYRPSKSILVLACIAASLATIIVGFGWGGWVTESTSYGLAATAADAAKGDLASAICVERFKSAPDATARLADFKAIADSLKKREFVEAGGWATMPGEESPNRLGAIGCATALSA